MKKFWHATVDAFETFLRVPGTVARKGAHVRDAIDLKRIMIIAVISVVPAAIFGMWNVGYQHSLAIGDGRLQILANFWYGFLKVLPLYVVAYGVGLIIEFFSAGIRNEEVNEGYLMSGMLIPLIVPVTVPLWMLAVAVAFSVIFVKEVFGGTGMNIWNPALVTRAFLFFSYPSAMSGSQCWISLKAGEEVVDGFTGATPLALDGAAAQYGTGIWDYIIGTIPGLDWADCNCVTDSYLENWYYIENDVVVVKNNFVDFSGFTDMETCGKTQLELPAAYIVHSVFPFGKEVKRIS